RLKFTDPRPKYFPPGFAVVGLDKANGCGRRGGRGGGRRGGKNETAGAVDEKINQQARTANKSAARAERLAERAHLDFNAVVHAQFICQPASIFAANTSRMCLIHHQPRSVFFLERDYFAQ